MKSVLRSPIVLDNWDAPEACAEPRVVILSELPSPHDALERCRLKRGDQWIRIRFPCLLDGGLEKRRIGT
ncbi:MAG: hypothetical protein HYS05_16900 [Acidobacteria bacterium]|nr:hypothetical protein [Acidobacteriota bacterium]